MAVVDGQGSGRRAQLLQVAADLFAERGYHAVSTDAIGHAAGISGPGVYRHFTSKADLLLTLCHAAMDYLLSGARRIVTGAASPAVALEELVAFHVDFAVRERNILAVYLREQRELPDEDTRDLRRRQREYEAIWCDSVGRCSELPAADARAAVKSLLSMLNGSALIGDGVAATRLTALLERLVGGALNGIGVRVPPPPDPRAPSKPVGDRA